jgi:UDP-N-acetylmuramoylalanine--D-glutamate ligase
MQNYKQQFKGKRITVMGLGILGRGLGYTKFLAECGADLIVTDLKTKDQLATSIKSLEKFSNIKFVLGEHRLEDFKDRDMIVKAAGVPLDSIYINEARKNGIPIEMDVSLFAKCAPEVMIIGVTGTRGKSMTTTLIYEILSKNIKDRNIYIGGNLRGVATLPLLKKVKSRALMDTARHDSAESDILVCELDSWQLQGFSDAKISPHISVFTTFMPDHMNYYKDSMEKYFNDKANIFKYQKKDDTLIIRPGMKNFINKKDVKGKFVVVNPKNVTDWKFSVPGVHHRENLACAVKVAEVLGIPENKIKKAVANFKDLEGRLQLLKIYKGIKIYNDNNATTPEATIIGIEALAPKQGLGKRKIVLICGGASKHLPLDNFVKTVNKYCKAVVMIPGTGTEELIKNLLDGKAGYKLLITNEVGKDLKDIVKKALVQAKKSDIILFSPAFASFGMFNNEYERNDLFMKIIKNLK